MQPGNDRRSLGKAGQMRRLTCHPPDDLIGTRGRRQSMDKFLQPKEPQGLLAVFLCLHIGKGGTCLRAIRTDDACQAIPQPVLAAQEMTNAFEPLGFHVADPGKQCRWCGDMRDLTRELDGLVGDIAFHPPIDDGTARLSRDRMARPKGVRSWSSK
ncbi:hypothetical protein AJ87_39835 [Rhizobium yanglingense]|nr:hypothetical protein AJ87_39835 [Rhizobium yanglingense]